MQLYLYMCLYTCVYICLYVHAYLNIYTHIYDLYVYVHIHAMCIYIYTHKHKYTCEYTHTHIFIQKVSPGPTYLTQHILIRNEHIFIHTVRAKERQFANCKGLFLLAKANAKAFWLRQKTRGNSPIAKAFSFWLRQMQRPFG